MVFLNNKNMLKVATSVIKNLIINFLNDSIFIAQDRVIKFSNPATEKITGYSFNEVVNDYYKC